MKNQYFGDNRDLFKYDLIWHIMQTGLINHFTFIPMLTEDDDTEHGENRDRKKAKAGTENKPLVKFLDKYRVKSKRNIKELEGFFKDRITIYGKNKYFSHLQRKEYFKQIEDKLLSKSLVFVDPDTGLQVERSGKEHILYCEVKDLYKRMDKNSILMIYQHYPRMRTEKNIQQYFYERSEKLKNIAGDLPIYIDDNEIRFFFLTKDKSIQDSLGKQISKYKQSYPQLHMSKFLC